MAAGKKGVGQNEWVTPGRTVWGCGAASPATALLFSCLRLVLMLMPTLSEMGEEVAAARR
jgi:hypothetical protein